MINIIEFIGNKGHKQSVKIVVKDGFIKDIKTIPFDSSLPTVTPGLIDLQINGYKGYDFNAGPLNESKWESVIKILANVGITTFYPTIITNDTKNIMFILEENMKILSERPDLLSFIGGFHLEGPYISSVEGPRGAHEKRFVKAPDINEFNKLQEKAMGMIKLVTLAPEWEGAPEFIKEVVSKGVKVAIGHTAADTEQITLAIQSGASMSTHLGNGAHAMLERHPNYIWDQLAPSELWASVIADGNHLPINVLNVIKKVKGSKMILVSDSVTFGGLEAGNYETPAGTKKTLTKEGKIFLTENPDLLGGSAQNLLQIIQKYVENEIGSLYDALERSSILPAKLMGLDLEKGLKVGAPADIMLINTKKDYKVLEVYKNGVNLKELL